MEWKGLIPWRKQGAEAHEMPFAALQREMNDMFDSIWREWPRTKHGGEAWGEFVPKVEVAETEKFYELSAELPGMTEKEISVTVAPDANAVIIRGEKKFEEEKKEKNMYRCERSYGSFMRALPLPGRVDAERTESKLKDGVLEVRLPKIGGPAPGEKNIKITTG
jgi:HSP20 family protein